MGTTIGRWVVSLLWSFDLVKAKVEKHLSSSMLPIIHTMANSTNLMYLGKLKTNIEDVVTRHHIMVNGLVSKRPPYKLLHLTSLWAWTCLDNSQDRQHSKTFTFEPFAHPPCALFCHNSKLFKEPKSDWQNMHQSLVATDTKDTQSQEHSWHHGLET